MDKQESKNIQHNQVKESPKSLGFNSKTPFRTPSARKNELP